MIKFDVYVRQELENLRDELSSAREKIAKVDGKLNGIIVGLGIVGTLLATKGC